MERLTLLVLSTVVLSCSAELEAKTGGTILSTVLTPDSKEKTLVRQGRSYYDPRYGPRPLYDRLEYARLDYDRPPRSGGCGRCYDERYDDRDDRDYDRGRGDRYDDDRRASHRPTAGNRFDRNKYDNEDDDRRYNTERNSNNKNGTDDENDNDKKRPHDEDDRDRPNSNRNRNRNRDRNRYDDRDRYRPDYYDRFLTRDPYRDRPGYDRERPYYDDPHRERRPLYDRYDDPYGGFGGRYDGYGYPGYRRPVYDDRYDRGYDDAYGGYGPGVGRGPHDRPWDETYRGQAGWDAGGRGYYFASGRPEPAPAAPAAPAPAGGAAWQRPDYARPSAAEPGWQSAGGGAGAYAGGYRDYRDPLEYRGSLGYGQSSTGYRQDLNAGYGNGYSFGSPQGGGYSPAATQPAAAGYGQGYPQSGYDQGGYSQGGYVPATGQGYAPSGWHSVGERVRPYRDQSGVNQIDNRDRDRDRDYRNPPRDRDRYPQAGNRQPANGYGQNNNYNQNTAYGQTSPQSTGYSSSSTTPQTSYLYQRDDEQITKVEETTKSS